MNRPLRLAAALLLLALAPALAESPLASLCLPAGIAEQPFCLAGGAWEGTPYVAGGAARPRVELVRNLGVAVDLDGDGAVEEVGLVVRSAAGTGSLVHLVVARAGAGGTTFLGSAPVGDRVQLRALRVEGNELRLDVVRHGAEEPMCCPTRRATLHFGWRDGRLAALGESDEGAISLADLAGITWTLARLARDEAAPEGPPPTLLFADGQVSGSAGCNRFTGSIRESAPRRIAIGPLAVTRMACLGPAAALEARLLAALGGTTEYSFVAGELVLSGETAAGERSSLFYHPGEPRQGSSPRP